MNECIAMCIIHLHNKFHVPIFNGPLPPQEGTVPKVFVLPPSCYFTFCKPTAVRSNASKGHLTNADSNSYLV